MTSTIRDNAAPLESVQLFRGDDLDDAIPERSREGAVAFRPKVFVERPPRGTLGSPALRSSFATEGSRPIEPHDVNGKLLPFCENKGYDWIGCSGRPMKAIVHYSYGSPAVLKYEEIEKPTADEGQVLIRVRAASVNPLDCHYMRGTPYVLRAMTGVRGPKATRLGTDVAGQVEGVGRNVTQFQPGDEIFGASRGAFAEYVCADENRLALKPANITFEQAAAVPVASRDKLRREGEKDVIWKIQFRRGSPLIPKQLMQHWRDAAVSFDFLKSIVTAPSHLAAAPVRGSLQKDSRFRT